VEIAPGLLRWTAPHPDWCAQDDWERDVGCVLYEAPDALVLIDPLLATAGRDEFLAWLDRRVAGRMVSVLTTIHWHERDRHELIERYCTDSSLAPNRIPAGVKPWPLREAGETMFWLPDAATLVPGDRLIGAADGGLQVCPQDWLDQAHVDRAGLATLMGPLLELPIERVLVSHGEPVLRDGRAALSRALAAAVSAGVSEPKRGGER
jgi:hypothetical protein